jgi:hypothetical protein
MESQLLSAPAVNADEVFLDRDRIEHVRASLRDLLHTARQKG